MGWEPGGLWVIPAVRLKPGSRYACGDERFGNMLLLESLRLRVFLIHLLPDELTFLQTPRGGSLFTPPPSQATNAPDTWDSKTQNVLLANPQCVSLQREASVSFVSADHDPALSEQIPRSSGSYFQPRPAESRVGGLRFLDSQAAVEAHDSPFERMAACDSDLKEEASFDEV